MSPWWLLLIIPVSASVGVVITSLCVAAKTRDYFMEKEAAQHDSERQSDI